MTEGVRRYGFHGLSYESIVRTLGDAGTHGAMIVATSAAVPCRNAQRQTG